MCSWQRPSPVLHAATDACKMYELLPREWIELDYCFIRPRAPEGESVWGRGRCGHSSLSICGQASYCSIKSLLVLLPSSKPGLAARVLLDLAVATKSQSCNLLGNGVASSRLHPERRARHHRVSCLRRSYQLALYHQPGQYLDFKDMDVIILAYNFCIVYLGLMSLSINISPNSHWTRPTNHSQHSVDMA